MRRAPPPVAVPCFLPNWYLCLKANLRDSIRAHHVAITRDGIKFVVDKHKTGCRLECQEKGKVSKTVPFDKITDCDVEEPAGASGPCCCLVPNVLSYVNVDTASSPPGGHELHMAGLKDPNQFKKDVWAMKRGEPVDGIDSSVMGAAPIEMKREAEGGGWGKGALFAGGGSGAGGGGGSSEKASLLRELREQSAFMRQHHNQQSGLLLDIAAAIREQTGVLKSRLNNYK